MNNDVFCPEQDVLARTIYGESRGEYYRPDGGLAGMMAVACVMRNRVNGKSVYGNSYQEVCRKPYQFSCWNRNDPNYLMVSRIKLGDDRIFDLCQTIAKNIITETWPDITKGSNHYHASWMKTYPNWAEGRTPQYRCGQHIFYKL